MKTEKEIRNMLETHLSEKPTMKVLKQLVKENHDTTMDYWRGYYEGVTFGYKSSLEE